MKENDYKESDYLNFPIQMVEGLIPDRHRNSPKRIYDEIAYYAIYRQSRKSKEWTEIKRIKDAINFFDFSIRDESLAYSDGKRLYERYPLNSPRTGISKQLFFEFSKNDKTDFEIATLTAFLALKSIVGDKPYMRISNLFMLSRMDGKVKSVKDKKELSSAVRKYATEYYAKRLRNELFDNWGLVYVQSRGVCISFTLTLNELQTAALKETVKSKDRFRSKQMREAKEEAVKQVNAKQK
ncbi:MAG: hypothetical protein FD155_557 [Bacteroidetes bacterium]|nr:MAG: hypothetical protein FD155_557 [Bacteroidota bacterium]